MSPFLRVPPAELLRFLKLPECDGIKANPFALWRDACTAYCFTVPLPYLWSGLDQDVCLCFTFTQRLAEGFGYNCPCLPHPAAHAECARSGLRVRQVGSPRYHDGTGYGLVHGKANMSVRLPRGQPPWTSRFAHRSFSDGCGICEVSPCDYRQVQRRALTFRFCSVFYLSLDNRHTS